MRTERLKGMGLMLLCTILWSFQGLFTKLIPWDPIALSGFRGLFSGLAVYLYMRLRKIPFTADRRSLAIGFCSFMAAWTCVAAHHLTSSANAVLLQYTSPVFFLLLSALLFHRRFRKADLFVVGIVMGSVILFFLDELSPGNVWGNLSALLCGLTYGSMFLFTGEARAEERFSGIVIGALLSFLFCAPFALFRPSPMDPQNLFRIFLMGAVLHGFPYVLYCLSFQHCPPMASVLISTVEILLNPLWVLLALGEKPGPFAALGGGILLVTVTIWNLFDAKATAKKEA